MSRQPALLAEVVRNDFVESEHWGYLSICDESGRELAAAGNTTDVIFARSALKPLQLVAMLNCGLDSLTLPTDLLALMASSHSGQQVHVDGVHRILEAAGLNESELQNTPAVPMDSAAREQLRTAGALHKAAIYADCSGKHAAMLATCAQQQWSRDTYRDAEHPLQRAIAATVSSLTGDDITQIAIDGCGAPLFSSTTRGLARAYATLVAGGEATHLARVARAMHEHPVMVAGEGRDVTAAMQSVPGLVVKDGAEGVMAAGYRCPTRGHIGIALKVLDGSARARAAVLAAALRAYGVEESALNWARTPVYGGGRVVGQIQPAFSLVWNA